MNRKIVDIAAYLTAWALCFTIALSLINHTGKKEPNEKKGPGLIESNIDSIGTCVYWWTQAGTDVVLATHRCEGLVSRLDSFGSESTPEVLKARSDALWACVNSMPYGTQEDFESRVTACEHIVSRLGK